MGPSVRVTDSIAPQDFNLSHRLCVGAGEAYRLKITS